MKPNLQQDALKGLVKQYESRISSSTKKDLNDDGFQKLFDCTSHVRIKEDVNQLLENDPIWQKIVSDCENKSPDDSSKSSLNVHHDIAFQWTTRLLNIAPNNGGTVKVRAKNASSSSDASSTATFSSSGTSDHHKIIDFHKLVTPYDPLAMSATPIKSADEVIAELMTECCEEDQQQEDTENDAVKNYSTKRHLRIPQHFSRSHRSYPRTHCGVPPPKHEVSSSNSSSGTDEFFEDNMDGEVTESIIGETIHENDNLQVNDSKELSEMSVCELSDCLNEIEHVISNLSSQLVINLSDREELEYEKEMKNKFISLFLSIQSKRRKVRKGCNGSLINNTQNEASRSNTIASTIISQKDVSNNDFNYLNTVIPFVKRRSCEENNTKNDFATPKDLEFVNDTIDTIDDYNSFLSISTLECLVKILHAIDSNSDSVAELLTDYILKVICPPSSSSS